MKGKITCTNCGWSWNRADGGDDMYICHKCGHNNFYSANELFKKGSWFKGNLSFLNW
jgi:predicted nucleic-acid-binding Zn-ribbon protein